MAFRLVLDGIPGLVLTFTPDGETEFVNREVREYFGLTREALPIHPDDLEGASRTWQQSISAGTPFTFEHRLRRADGVYRWFQLRASPSFDTDGRLVRWYGCLTDIETEKQTRDTSRSTANVLPLVDIIPGLVFTNQPNGELDWVNRTIRAYFGRPLEDLQSWRMTDSIHPDDLPITIDRWQAGIASGEPYEFEHRLRRHDGVYRWFQFRAAPLRDANGVLLRWYGLVTDIDDLKRAQEASHESERNLRLLIDSIPGMVYTMTAACDIELVNGHVLEYFGHTFEELKEWERFGLVHVSDLPRVKESLRRTVLFGEPPEVERRLRRADGVYRWFASRAVPLRDTDGRIVRWYCILSDIDDLKRAEEGLRNIQSQLARAAQLATVSELAASIAHEINQPLAAVVANGHACHRWLSDAPLNIDRALLSVERIIRSGNLAADIISRIRSLFRQALPAKQPLNLNQVIEEVCRLIADELRTKGIALKLELQPDLPVAEADRVQMQQVIANLARNSIDALETVQGRAREFSISSCACGGEITVTVIDAGVGLGDEGAVFEAFYTTKTNGMGMGLAICKSILDAHGGRLWALRNASHGATFGFALRIADAQ